jgi:hypothetical protein
VRFRRALRVTISVAKSPPVTAAIHSHDNPPFVAVQSDVRMLGAELERLLHAG